MNRRMVGCFILVFASICLLPKLTLAEEQRDNAATYYNKAFELCTYSYQHPLNTKVTDIIKNGWKVEDKELEELLKQNALAFTEFKRGLRLEKCDFTFGKEYKYLINRDIPNLLKVRNLSNLLLLNSRYYEKQKEFNRAVNVCLSCLEFAKYVSQDDSSVAKAIAIGIEKETCVPLRDYLTSGQISRRKSEKILAFLEDYEKEHFAAGELLEVEKDLFISNIQMLTDSFRQEAQKSSEFNEDARKAVEGFEIEMMRQGKELADRYYGNFIKAAQTNKESDWEFAANEFNSFTKDALKKTTIVKDAGSMFLSAFKEDIDQLNQKLAKTIVSLTLSISLVPNFKGIVENYYSTLEELKEVKSLAKIKTERP
jgi:hypothetical protein